MKKTRFLYLFAIVIAILALASQAFAAPSHTLNPKKTPGANVTETADDQNDDSLESQNTPGAKATEKALEKAGKLKGKPEHYKGTIQSVDAGSLTLDVAGASITVTLAPETRIHIPGNADTTLQPGLMAMVRARRDANNNLIASAVQVIPGKPTRIHRVGIVTAYSTDSITIQAHDGNSYTFSLSGDLKILPAERANQLAIGALVTIIAPRQPGNTGFTATGVVVHPAGSGAGAFGKPKP